MIARIGFLSSRVASRQLVPYGKRGPALGYATEDLQDHDRHVRLSDIELGFACTRSGAFAASRAIGNDWADRFPAVVEATARLKALSFLIDGEAGIARDDRTQRAAR